MENKTDLVFATAAMEKVESSVCVCVCVCVCAAALLCQITEWRSVIISLIGALPQEEEEDGEEEEEGGDRGRGQKGGGVMSLFAGKMVW